MTKEAQAVADAMDYETYINIKQYSTDGYFSYTLRVIDVMNMDYYYSGSAKTLNEISYDVEAL